MTRTDVIRLESVDVAYHGTGVVLSVDSLRIAAGETVAVIGPSGGGKTTLLRSIKGHLPLLKGSAEVLGTDLAKANRRAKWLTGRQVAYIPQQFHLVPQLSVLKNTLSGRLGRTSRWRSLLGLFNADDKREAWSSINEVGLAAKVFQRASALSGGEQQRVAIARALAQEPLIILADEPVSSLDPAWAEDVLQLLQEVQSHHAATLVMTLHQPELARRFAQRILGLREGKIAFDLPSDQVTDRILEELYEGDAKSAEPTSVSTTPTVTVSALPSDPKRTKRWIGGGALAAALIAALAWSASGTEMSAKELASSGPRIAEFFDRMWPPDMAWEPTEARPFPPPLRLAGAAIAVTLQISILGTAIGAAFAFALGLLGANNLTRAWIHLPVKMVLALVRSLPIILLALVFVSALGLGPMPGVLAVAVHSIGMLGKLYAEEFETADRRVWEAIDNTGANWLQKIRYALLPQAMRQIASHTLLRFEMNLRESAVLGLVGVGGLGLWIENYRRAFDYPSVATMVILTILLVLAVDQLTMAMRKRLV